MKNSKLCHYIEEFSEPVFQIVRHITFFLRTPYLVSTHETRKLERLPTDFTITIFQFHQVYRKYYENVSG